MMLIYIALFIILCIVYVGVALSMRPTRPYRLGDVFWRTDKDDDLHYHTQMYPGTIASEYLKRSPRVSENWDVLLNIIDKQRKKREPPIRELVLHVRIGDVLCVSPDEYNYARKNQPEWWNKLAEFIQRENIQKVHIMAGNHTNMCVQESKEYLDDRASFLRDQDVEFHLDKSADEDLLFATTYQYFITTGGGYGNLIGEVTRRMGNIWVELDDNKNQINP